MIGVVDYRAGNAPSVMYALDRLGLEARLVAGAQDVRAVDRLILPGVGAARATIDSLAASGLVDALTHQALVERVPFLGICIGLQVLFERSEEGPTKCLGWLPGEVLRFPSTGRVPQIGWNGVRFDRPHPLVAALPDPSYCYFVNSYHAIPADPAVVLGRADYSVEFTAMVAHGNIAATQFHAEKSGELGLRILSAFATWDGAPC
ncbi:MAG: imidazole glycerol phosphate synthase subunit HisH [Actinobacteria bacterium]|nr:imidazole glycerol phosphate synthase subunit HisH [Actinomycetota bacterium]